jgi:uncharacterized SAM-binding protein YcdF (DUF218 family)
MGSVFFIAGKLVGVLLIPDYWLLALAAGAVVALWRGRTKTARVLITSWLTVFLILGLVPLGDWIMASLEVDNPPRPFPAQVDGIVILGGVEDHGAGLKWGGAQLNEAAERLTVGAALARVHPQSRVVFTGGRGALRDFAQSDTHTNIGAQFLRQAGVPDDRLIIEPSARNTTENARLSFQLATPQKGDVWVLITSAAHMPRALRSFANAGWPEMEPMPVDHRSHAPSWIGWRLARNLNFLNSGLRELVGRMAYDLLGR